ncbi:SOS response-associated peptidase family protein [Muricauda sp. 334s03]|uniref:Abasic site processing protein n=1 Tax=Flagellimonas yonaguniensis TaxID=3031325 RepID=A0ABT5XVN4_9FLAO|nr:SOS response-associated peptidase family protein [[Muricauda] yonaguniensis]MDF0715241.1 SOS response-associated peptidase family protein [[Muricauda] yonaguniensis]
MFSSYLYEIFTELMIYKLSNEAERDVIEKEFGIPFRYPNLFRPNPIINGFHETNLGVVTMENQNEITFAIWGLMPQDFKEDWHIFQDNANTLNVQMVELESIAWMQESFKKRRCLVIVTGFYTHLLENGNTCSYYIHQASNKPFYLAGTYNILNDGFLCTAITVSKTEPFVSSYHNISHLAPVIVPKEHAALWLNKNSNMDDLKEIIQNPKKTKLEAKRMSNEFFLKNLTSNTEVEPLFAHTQFPDH